MNLSPVPIQKFFDNNGAPLVSGLLFTYVAGTSTKIATYTDSTGGTPNTNPIVLNFRGECSLWIDPTKSYKFVLAPSTDTDPPGNAISTTDNITAGPAQLDNAAVDTGSVNNIAISIPLISSPVAFTRIVFKAANTNTGATTIAINGGAAKALTLQNIAPMAGGEIQSGGEYQAIFDGAQWQLQGPCISPDRLITASEVAAAKTPAKYFYPPFDPRRYSSLTDYSAVIATVGTLAQTYDGWYRGDRSLHPSLSNCIVGYQAYNDAQQTGTIGYRCTAFGSQALQFNSSSVSAGGTNSAFGWASLQHNIDGSGNSAFGPLTLNSLTGINSSHNNVFGYRGFPLLVNGTQNNAFGFQCGDQLVTGDNNHLFGENTMSHNVTGSGNHLFGYQCNYTKTAGDYTHAFGYQALFSENAIPISGISKAASAVITSSQVSVNNPFTALSLIGFNSVGGMTQINGLTGTITAVGGVSGAWTATTDINSSAFSVYTSGGSAFPLGNTAFGYQVGSTLTSSGSNTIAGWQAVSVNPPGAANSIYGFQAGMRLSTGGQLNCAFGWQSLVNCLGGGSNACFGQQSGKNVTTGSSNVCVGDNSGNGVSTASGNVSVGSITAINLNGDNNTCVGTNAGSQGSAQTFTNTSSFGKDATPTASNQVTLGNTSVTTLRCQVTTITAISDQRDKTEIAPLSLGLDFINQIPVRQFKWNKRDGINPHDHLEAGFIAQELQQLQHEAGVDWLGLVLDANPERLEATPGKLLPILVKAVQELSAQLAEARAQIEAMRLSHEPKR